MFKIAMQILYFMEMLVDIKEIWTGLKWIRVGSMW